MSRKLQWFQSVYNLIFVDNSFLQVANIIFKVCLLVDILGKKKLEERVRDLEFRLAELKNENENLNCTLEKRDEKIRKLSYAYQ